MKSISAAMILALGVAVGLSAYQARAETKPVRMERFVVSDKYLLSFGVAVTLMEDRNTHRVLEMSITAVQSGSMAEDKGLCPGTKIWSIDGRSAYDFPATFDADSDLGEKFLNRRSGDVIVLEVTLPTERKTRFVSLTQNPLEIAFREPLDQLGPVEKARAEKGEIHVGFTRGMVDLAAGKPTKVKHRKGPDGDVELWIYGNFIPSGTGHSRYSNYESDAFVHDVPNPSHDPAEAVTYSLFVLFERGKVSKVGLRSDQ
jgi:hypothetical protein